MFRPIILALLTALVAALPAAAQEPAASSAWSKGSHSSLRLIAGATAPSGKQRVGIEIVMKPGFKTYWRNPGEAGVPPAFDWSGSSNVGGLDVRWPAPERFSDGRGFALGYVGEVVIPVSVQPTDPTKPVRLQLKLDYAVCDLICVPVRGEARLFLEPGVTSVTSPRLETFEARVPVQTKLGQGGDRLAIVEAKGEESGETGLVRLVLRPQAGGAVEDVFVEGPGSWSFAKPELIPQSDSTVHATLKVTERPKGSQGANPFVITVRGRPFSIETRLDLDIPTLKP